MTDPKDIELEAACSLTEQQARAILAHNQSLLNQIFDGNKEVKFRFNQYDLLSYLRNRPEVCNRILTFSNEKRYTSSIFFEEYDDGYRVGWFDNNREQVITYDKLYEAVTDFVLFSWNLGRLHRAEHRLPKHIRDKAIESGNEFGWRQADFKEVIDAARGVPMAIIGGQIQYVTKDGTCELYWLSYDPEERQKGENWLSYCNRTADECIEKFNNLVTNIDIEKDALMNFKFLKKLKDKGVKIDENKIFIIDFDDSETDLWSK